MQKMLAMRFPNAPYSLVSLSRFRAFSPRKYRGPLEHKILKTFINSSLFFCPFQSSLKQRGPNCLEGNHTSFQNDIFSRFRKTSFCRRCVLLHNKLDFTRDYIQGIIWVCRYKTQLRFPRFTEAFRKVFQLSFRPKQGHELSRIKNNDKNTA